MADQPSHYLILLDDIACIDPSMDRAKELFRLSEEPVKQGDALDLLLLAEQAVYTGQWQAAAQLFSRMMVSSFSKRYSDADMVEHAKRIILLTTGHATELRSLTDLLLYGHRRLTAALRRDGIQQPYLDEWTVSALSQLLCDSKDRIAEMHSALALLQSSSLQISKGFRREISPTRKLLSCSLRLHGEKNAWIWVSEQGRDWHRLWLGLAVVVIAIVAYKFGHLFPMPVSAVLDRSWPGSLLRTALVAWPFLLIATWRFAFSESKRTHTFQYISPIHLLSRGKIIAGEIVSFSRDWFFHIFQFVWIVLLVIAWLLFRKYPELLGCLPSVCNSPAQTSLAAFTNSLTPSLIHLPAAVGFWNCLTAFWGNDLIALAAAIAVALRAIWVQWNIQDDRDKTSTDFYWWDRRVNPTEWWIRLIMVGVDLFLVSFLLAKVLMTLFATYALVTTNVLKISIFSPDGVGGLKNLTDVLMYLSWIVFLFGIFVFASLYLHWGLRAYRRMDLGLVFAYVLLFALMVTPLRMLDSKLSTEKDRYLQQLASTSDISGKKLDDVAKYVQNVNLVSNWRVSASKVGILGNGVLPLGFQFVVILVQFLGRAGKLPKLLIPLLGEKSATAGGHGEH
jgi:hypothetical protein